MSFPRFLSSFGVAVLLWPLQSLAEPLGTAFTYQEHLKESGTSINEPVDLRFSLWSAATEGNQIGSTIELLNQAVADGRFTVNLDFGTVRKRSREKSFWSDRAELG